MGKKKKTLLERAKEGDAGAMFAIGEKMYQDCESEWHKPEGMYEAAFQWFTIAAELGEPRAMERLGYMYAGGKGVEKDYTKALHWAKKAFNEGNDDAQVLINLIQNVLMKPAEDNQKKSESENKSKSKKKPKA